MNGIIKTIYFLWVFTPKNPANEEEQEFLVDSRHWEMPIVESDLHVFYDAYTKVLAITRSF
jgi:hypothetical protein